MAAQAPRVGEILDGYRFLGGDPGDEKSWEEFGGEPQPGDLMDGYVFKGGDPSKQDSWEKPAPKKGLIDRAFEALKPSASSDTQMPETDEFMQRGPESAPEPERLPNPLAPKFDPMTNPADAMVQEAAAKRAAETPPPRVGPTVEAAEALRLKSAAEKAAPVAARGRAIARSMDATPEIKARADAAAERTWADFGRDVGRKFVTGTVSAAQDVAWLTRKGLIDPLGRAVEGENYVSNADFEKAAGGTIENINEDMSAKARGQAEDQKKLMDQGGWDGFTGAIGYVLANPSMLPGLIAESAAATAGIGAAGARVLKTVGSRVMLSKGAETAIAGWATGAAEGLQTLGNVGRQIEEELDKAGIKDPADRAQALRQAIPAALVTMLAGRFGGGVEAKWFADLGKTAKTEVERKALKTSLAGALKTVGKDTGKEMLEELEQGTGEQLFQNLGQQSVGVGEPDLSKGVGANAAFSAAAALGQGGGASIKNELTSGRLGTDPAARTASGLIDSAVRGATINPQAVDAAAVEAMRNPTTNPVADLGLAVTRPSPYRTPEAFTPEQAAATIAPATSVDDAIRLAGAALDLPTTAVPTSYGKVSLPAPPLARGGFTGEATGEKSEAFLAQEAQRELQTDSVGGGGGLIDIAQQAPATPAGGVVSTPSDTAAQQAEAVAKRGRGELLSSREVELARQFDEKPAPKIVIAGRETDVAEASDGELEHAAKLTRSPETRQIIVEEQRRRQEPAPTPPEAPKLALPDNRAAGGETLVTFPDGSAMPAAEARARQLQTPDTQEGARKARFPVPPAVSAGQDIAMAEAGEQPKASVADSADYLNERRDAEERATSMDIARGARKVDEKGYFATGERQRLMQAASAAGRDPGEIEQAVRDQKARFPARDGWAPVEFSRINEKAETPGAAVEYKVVPWTYHVPPGKTMAAPAHDQKHADNLATKMTREVDRIVKSAKGGDKNAQAIVDQMHWYRGFTEKLRQKYGGFGSYFADVLGATSPQTTVPQNFKSAKEAASRFLRGDYDVELRKLEKHLASGKDITKFPASNKIRKATGELFGTNSAAAMQAMLGVWRDAVKGNSPKARNFAKNLIGDSDKATIDSWAARTLQRLAGKPRIPPPAEAGVTGRHLKDPAKVGGAFGFGQLVFEKAAEKLKAAGTDITPADLQAMMWFAEKALWTKNNWTSAEGEGGSFEEEIGKSETDRYQGLMSVQQGGETPAEDAVAAARGSVEGVLSADPRVEMYRVIPTEGGYMDDTEQSLDVEAVADREWDPMPLVAEMVREAKKNNQDSVGLSRVVRPDEKSANARPGVEVYLKRGASKADVMAISKALRDTGAGGFTLAVDPRVRRKASNRPSSEYIGIRVQYVPEIFIRAYHQGWVTGEQADADYADLTSGDDARVQAVMDRAEKALDGALQSVRENPSVSHAEGYHYDTLLIGKEDYDAYRTGTAGEEDQESGGGVWPGESAGERLQGAARRHAAAVGVDPRSLRGSGVAEEAQGEDGQLRRDGGQRDGEGDAGAAEGLTPRASQTFPVPQVSKDTPVFVGREQQPDAVTVVAVRYGHEKRTSLNGRSYGKGVPGQEYLRIMAERDTALRDRLLNRVYFYAQTADELPRAESIITGINVSRVKFTNLYDLGADPRGFKEQAREEAEDGPTRTNIVERLIMEAGFDGYLAKSAIPSPALVLLDIQGNVPAEYLGFRYQANEKLKAAAKADNYDKAHHEAVTSAIAEVVARAGGEGLTWPDGTKMHVVPTERGVPEGPARVWLSERAPGSIEGFYDPGNKDIWIISKNLPSVDRAIFVATAHEVFHAGLRNLLGPKDVDPVLISIYQRNANVRALAARRVADGMSVPEATEEVLADMPDRGEVKGWDKLLALIKDFLAKLGIVKWTDAQVEMLVAAARASVRNPGGPVSVTEGGEIAASEKAPIFYSELSRQIAAAKTDNMPAPQWKAFIDNLTSKGVKKDEIEWSGVKDYLDMQKGNVPRQEIISYLANNGVQVEEKMLGEAEAPVGWNPVYQSGDEWVFEGRGIRGVGDTAQEAVIDAKIQVEREAQRHQKGGRTERAKLAFDNADALDPYIEALAGKATGGGAAKFASYQLPGGKNYRELLLTLPTDVMGGVTNVEEYEIRGEKFVSFEFGGAPYKTELRGRTVEAAIRERIAAQDGRQNSALFRSPHFDTPNILAHVRFNERTDADGKRILFLEEIQSDWAQRGRDAGFTSKEGPKLTFVRVSDEDGESREPGTNRFTNEYVFRTPDGNTYSGWGDTKEEAEQSLMEWLSKDGSRMTGIPVGPFVTKTEAWVALAMKRMIRYAADNGFDGIAWTNGEQQADRYDLSKQVAWIGWAKSKDGEYRLRAQEKGGGRDLFEGQGWKKPEQLADMIGKEAADKVVQGVGTEALAGTGEERMWGKGNAGVLKGLDLKVGGEGMAAFYDRIVPNVANDVLKKLGGGRVGAVNFEAERKFVVVDALGREAQDRWRVDEVYADGARVAYAAAPTQARAQSVAERENAKLQGKSLSAQPGFYLTPELKAKAMQGMPLFSPKPEEFDRGTTADIADDDLDFTKPRGLADLAGAMGKATGAMKTDGTPEEFRGSLPFQRALDVMRANAEDEWAFKYGKSDSRDWNQIVKDMRLDDIVMKVEPVKRGGGKPEIGIILHKKRLTQPIVDFSTDNPASQALNERVIAYVNFGAHKEDWQSDDEITPAVWVDSSALQKGEGGKAIYQLIYTWAANNGYIFVPDPASVSPSAVEARVANGLSAALRLGTTKYMMPFTPPDMVNGHYQWTIPQWLIRGSEQWAPVEAIGDAADEHNMRLLMEAQLAMANDKLKRSSRNAKTKIADDEIGLVDSLSGFLYDYSSEKIVYEDTGEPVDPRTLDRIAETLIPPGTEILGGGGARRGAGAGVPAAGGQGQVDAAQAGTPSRRGARAALVRAVVIQSALGLSAEDAGALADRVRDNAGSAVGTPRGEFLASRRPDWVKNGSPELQSAASKIDTYAPGQSFGAKLNALRPVWKEAVVQGVFDAYAPLKRLGRTEYILARMTKSADSSLEATLLYGKPVLGNDGVIHGQLDGKGFLGHLKDLKGEHDRFLMWVAGNRADRLKGQNRENLFDQTEIDAMKALDQGTMADGSSRRQAYANAQLALNSYNKAVLDVAQKAGLIDGAARQIWEHEFYVPFFRMDEASQSGGFLGATKNAISGPSVLVKGLVRQKAFEKLKGGTENLGDLLDNTMRNWSHLLSASLANQAAVASLKAAERMGIATRVASGTKGATYVMQNGQQVWYDVSDPYVLSAVSALESASFKGLPMKLMGKFKHYLTLGVTVSPTFRVRNLMRDSISAIAQNDLSYNAAKNVFEGWAAMDKSKPEYQEALFNGAIIRFGQLTDGKHAEHAKRLLEMGVPGHTILNTPAKTAAALGALWDWWQETGDTAENVNRISRYRQGLQRGESALEAAYASRDMLDFSLQGSWAAVRFLTQIVAFLNARLQGMYKLGRSANEDPGRFGAVAGMVALVSIALLLAYEDDEEWKKREDWDRDNFWWFKIGDVAFRIPKPFELGAIGTIAERSVEAAISDEMTGKRFRERMISLLADTLALDPTPQFFKPMRDIYANKDSFSGRMIETRGMENLSKGERAAINTTLLAKGLSKLTGLGAKAVGADDAPISPVQADYLVRSYFGWLGSHIAMAADLAAQPFMDVQKPARKLGDTFVIGDFVKDLPASRSRYTEEFYKQAKAIHEVMGDIKHAREAGDQEKIREIYAEKGDEIALARLYAATERKLSQVNKRMRQVQASELSPEVKRQRLDELEAVRNKFTEGAALAKVRLRTAKQQPALSE